MRDRSKQTVAPSILPESLPPGSNFSFIADGEAPVFAGRFAAYMFAPLIRK